MPFLPTTLKELNFNQPDFILVSVDAYVDHPSFGHAIISRLVEYHGFSIAIIPQPQTDAEYTALGEPKYGFLVSGGVVDSMVNNYTVAKIKRTTDSYSEGGKVGRIPDRALTVHTKNLRRLFPKTAILIGGIEASLRRFAHYDYWSNCVMPTLLQDAPADLLLYGMGETTIKAILDLAKKGVPLKKIREVAGTAYLEKPINLSKKLQKQIESGDVITMPSFGEVCSDKKKYVEAFNIQYKNSEHVCAKPLIQRHGKLVLVANPPQAPLDSDALDLTYTLPYMRDYHPMYKEGVPSLTEVKFSLTATRGCFGACNYCAITMHQGRIISKRSKQSLITEATELTTKSDFKGYIHDVGGPTANFRNPPCAKQATHGSCDNKTCIGFTPCKNLKADHSEYMDILRALRNIDGVKKVFVRSGIRFDYLMMDSNVKSILKELVEHHISGQLKVAPEHCIDSVLKVMNKTPFRVYKEFSKLYRDINKERGKEQFLVPYLIS
ncbi:MAG: YgiQ family radical SAM protein, partial [Bacillota bacterium]